MINDKINVDFPLVQDDLSISILTPEKDQSLMLLSSEHKIWEFAYSPLWQLDIFKKQWLDKAYYQMTEGKRYAFYIQYKQNAVGSSSFYNINEDNKTIAIGYTWYHPKFWGTNINTMIKYMLLAYIFEKLNYRRVEFEVDASNQRSQRAVLKIGAIQEGILRKHRIRPNGSNRDTVVFSIIDDDWPMVKNNLLHILKQAGSLTNLSLKSMKS